MPPPSLSTASTKQRATVCRALLFACALLLLPLVPPCLAAPADDPAPPAFAPIVSDFTAVRIDLDAREVQPFLKLWRDVMNRHVPEKAFGNSISALTPPVLAQWGNLAKLMPAWTAEKKLQNINGFFNRWDSKSDRANYEVEEYWASPEEFLEKGGDCEDFAIIKYLALRYFGWPEQDLWLLLLRENKSGEHHAALAAKTGEKIFILDNLSRPVYLLIPEKQYLRNFTPLYGINGLGMWMLTTAPPGAGQQTPSADNGTDRGGTGRMKQPLPQEGDLP